MYTFKSNKITRFNLKTRGFFSDWVWTFLVISFCFYTFWSGFILIFFSGLFWWFTTWMNRRSQVKHFNWDKFNLFLRKFPLPRPKCYVSVFDVKPEYIANLWMQLWGAVCVSSASTVLRGECLVKGASTLLLVKNICSFMMKIQCFP